MAAPLEFGKIITDSAPLFDGSKFILSCVFILLSITLSIITWRSRSRFTLAGTHTRQFFYWTFNAAIFCLGLYFFTRAFPRFPAGWVFAGVVIIFFAISGMTVVTTSKGGDKKADEKDKK